MSPGSRALALGRLLRLSLAPSALADVAAGCVLGAGAWPRGAAPFALMLASACVYHGGMALNDWADRAEDARTRPERPLPSGALRASSALVLAAVLLAAGPALAFALSARAGAVLLAVSACAALYDLAGRGPWRGPLLLGLCRAGNLGAGLALASTLSPWRPVLWLAPLAYGLYVFVVSRLARLEDVEPARLESGEVRPRAWALAAACALLGLGVAAVVLAGHPRPVWQPDWPLRPAFLPVVGAIGLFRSVRALGGAPLTASDVGRLTGMALRRLLLCSAALASAASTLDGLWVAGGILLGYPLAFALRKVFPPT